MKDAFPYVFNVLVWVVQLGGGIACAVLASQKRSVNLEMRTGHIESGLKDKSDKDEQRFREVHARIDLVDARWNEQNTAVVDRLARLEVNVQRIPHMEAKIDTLISNEK